MNLEIAADFLSTKLGKEIKSGRKDFNNTISSEEKRALINDELARNGSVILHVPGPRVEDGHFVTATKDIQGEGPGFMVFDPWTGTTDGIDENAIQGIRTFEIPNSD